MGIINMERILLAENDLKTYGYRQITIISIENIVIKDKQLSQILGLKVLENKKPISSANIDHT